MVRIYTRTGDSGSTFCAALGTRVVKTHPLIEFMGAIDEANSLLGYARIACSDAVEDTLRWFQRLIFRLGFSLSGHSRITEEDVKTLEEITDDYMKNVDLKGFILPGGSECSARIHIARTVVRRAERRLVAVIESGIEVKAGKDSLMMALKALNRLSDALFAMATALQAKEGNLEYL
ncbi:MAG: cob(I)yrinic acid a,c-diamide adenosyltransferase [Desulfurococcales archaeon]|nr:cob(I)yrinic acid a,c-diamide adenosyltransferase [Desulfurococcales archaeon]